jgi:hypothetical protein
MAWLPWLGAARTLMLPWSGHRKSHQGGHGRAERVRMGEREAFWAAVYRFTSPEWSPAFADQPTFDVNVKYLTIRQVCELVKDIHT